MNDFITKPIAEQALLGKLHRLLLHRCAGKGVESDGASDERLGRLRTELRDAFRAYVPQYLAALEETDAASSDTVRALAHQIAGAAATCYLTEIADAARALEQLIVKGGSGLVLTGRISVLQNALRQVLRDTPKN